ncbi:hypothetical protein [uncultured Maribacter sp.]|uniref:hypothetical protein n=1 Tax=uncultured Maribacter sp. TaxID=431308 RepID=UPI00262B3B43|nr:hypothetical protein [uncultured Maribacter sp.]
MKKSSLLLLVICLGISCKADKDLFESISDNNTVTLLFPEKNSECNTGTIISETESEVIFRWNDSKQNQSYEIHLTNLLTNSTQILESNELELSIRLLRGTPYSWSISSKNTSNVKNSSDLWSFYNSGPGVKTYIPFPATPTFPIVNSSLVYTPTINLSWKASDLDNDIISYDIYFDTDTPPELYNQSISNNSLNVPVNTQTTYYWLVVTRDLTGNESFSDIYSFSIE